MFRLDADTPVEVYGDERALAPGMQLLLDYFASNADARDELLPRLAFAVLQLERRFVREGATAEKVQEGILALVAARRERLGSTHPDVLGSLGTLYADTVSHLRPRVMVQGNPHYLGQAGHRRRRSARCCSRRCVRRCCGASSAAASGISCCAGARWSAPSQSHLRL